MNLLITPLGERPEFLPIYFHTVNDSHPQESVTRPRGIAELSQILIVVSGKGVLNCRGKSFSLKCGSAFFLSHDVPHDYFSVDRLTTAYVTLYGGGVEMLARHYACDGFLYYEKIDLCEFLGMLKEIMSEQKGKRRKGVISAMLFSFCVNFFEKNRENNQAGLENTLLYIQKNYSKKLSLTKLAEVNMTSVSKLCHDFKARYGVTCFEYIADYRLSTAQTLLKTDESISVKQAAHFVGYDDVSCFGRLYKKKYGLTPAVDRKTGFAPQK